jgi:G protein-coupled receptor GPR1
MADYQPGHVLRTSSTQSLGHGLEQQHPYHRVLVAISLGLGLLSTLATAFAFYWFVRMKRSFRHDLIMLLIVSDFIKSAWFVIFPIVDYTHGPIASESAFCQLSGFSLAVGVESSDVAVLLIALHSALYIIRPRAGLYPYRWIALAVYIMFPLLSTSLAFIDGNGKGYENIGYYCYLSNDGGWTRLSLSWIPRYISFVVILLMYVFIYLYVRTRILQYERKGSTVFQQDKNAHTTFTTPVVADCSRLSGPSYRRASAPVFKDRLSSGPSFGGSVPTGRELKNRSMDHSPTTPTFEAISWTLPSFGNSASALREPIAEEDQDPFSPAGPSLDAPQPTHSPTRRNSTAVFPSTIPSTIPSSRSSFGKSTEASEASLPQASSSKFRRISSFFIRASHDEGTLPFPSRWMPGATLTTINAADRAAAANVTNNRDKIRRQLRSLFVYPLVYVLIWIFPFVSHVKGDDSPSASPRPWLLALSLMSLAIQGAVDSVVFTAREKPWQHARGVGFWGSVWSVLEEGGDRVGRTREEFIVEGRIARARRQSEMIDEVGGRDMRRNKRQWWDVEDIASEAGGDDDERMRTRTRNEDWTMS